jgi:cell division protein FtsI/penicillin-binding protein 2
MVVGMRGSRASLVCSIAGALLLAAQTLAAAQTDASGVAVAMRAALRGTPAAAVVIDGASGRLLAVEKPGDAAMRRSAPGSILKPFFLASALKHGAVRPDTAVHCRRELRIKDRDLACTHPQKDISFDAEEALAYSCNTYFAELANRLSLEQVAEVLHEYDFERPSRLFAVEASADVRKPTSIVEKQLLVLGLAGIAVTPAQVAIAYRKLMLKLVEPRTLQSLRPVQQGLRDSVRYGMAHNADVPGLDIAGKTGTASDGGNAWTHGWFAGIVGATGSEMVVVIYLPRGNGADAARLAQRFFLACREASPR